MRVRRGADVTLVMLTYRSLRWAEWAIEMTDSCVNSTRYRWLVVANDAEDGVISGLQAADFDWIDHRNDDPAEFYINRVYRAWNRGVLEARTPYVITINSDMAGSDHWIDELMAVKLADRKTVPTSLLVESGRIPSAMPEYVRDFGLTPETFDAEAFRKHADAIRQPRTVSPGRLFMPMVVDRQEFIDLGGYPAGNPAGTTGDRDLVARYARDGKEHVTAMGSVVYHAQEGEMRG